LRRVFLAAALGAGAVGVLLRVLPLDSMSPLVSTLTGMGVLTLGGLLTLPFIWPELKLLLKL